VNKVANRKELRKQKRQEKGKRNAQHHMKRSFEPEKQQPSNKRQKPNQVKPEPKKPQVKKPEKAPAKKGMNDKEAMERLSKSNPGLFQLLESDKLVSEQDFADDDRDIAYWEKKLGMNKKKSKKLGKDFEEDGLLDVLGNIGDVKEQAGDNNDDDQTYLKKKRQSAMEKKKQTNMESKAEEVKRERERKGYMLIFTDLKQIKKAVDDMFAGFESEEEEDDDEEDDDEEDIDMDLNEDEDEDEEEDDDDEEEEEEEDDYQDEDDEDADMNQDSEEEEEDETPEKAATEVKSNAVLSKYVPPHLRKAVSGKSEQQLKLQKQLQGLLNRLSEMNMESILLDIEKCYGSYPRHGNDINFYQIRESHY
jgi:nucleolar MIF4G domain-containing protein 1